MKTVLRYAGGKSKAIKKITPFIPINTKKIISPFIGGGSLEVKWSSEMNIRVEGFDIFHHLVNFWNVLLNNRYSLANELRKLEPTKEVYKSIKEKLLCWEKTQELFIGYKTDYYIREPIRLNSITAAAYYYYNHNLSYGPGFLGWMSKLYEDERKYENMIKKIERFSNPNLIVRESSFENVIASYPNDLIYLDPPYYLGNDNDNKMFKGMYPMANFAFHHDGFNHELMRDLLYNHKGYFIISYNNCETIRNWYKDFYQYFPSWQYSYGQGETRIGKNKIDNSPKESHEILITNKKLK
jgi:DNA adenine methylase